MAEIPVEKKSSMTWLWVLLALLIAALLLWWLLDNDDDEVAEPVGVEAVQPVGVEPLGTEAAATDQAVTDISMLMPTIPPEMVGRQVQLTGVPILETVSDAGFWIGEGADRRIYAVLNEQSTPQTPTEGVADVNAGATANLTGTIRTRQEALQGLAAGSETDDLPQGVERFIVVSNYQVQGQGQ